MSADLRAWCVQGAHFEAAARVAHTSVVFVRVRQNDGLNAALLL